MQKLPFYVIFGADRSLLFTFPTFSMSHGSYYRMKKKLYHPPFKSPFRTDQQKDKHLHTAQLYNCLSVVIYNPSWNCWYLLIVVNFHSLWLNLCVCFMCVLAWINSGQFWKVCRFISRQIAYLFFVKLKKKIIRYLFLLWLTGEKKSLQFLFKISIAPAPNLALMCMCALAWINNCQFSKVCRFISRLIVCRFLFSWNNIIKYLYKLLKPAGLLRFEM